MNKLKTQGISYALYHTWQTAGNKPGWEIFEQGDLLLLKSPTNLANLNLAIGGGNADDGSIIQNFFKDKSFGVFEDPSRILELTIEPKVTLEITEMSVSTDKVQYKECGENIVQVKDKQQLAKWGEIAGAAFEMDGQELVKFMEPIYGAKQSAVFYFTEGDNVVGTGQVYIDDHKLAYIATIGVLESHRKQGAGSQLMNACVKFAKTNGAKTLALYASEMGEFLYHKLGFTPLKKWNFKMH
jgi:GNAT superfamily N-acetyltransferase